MSAPWEPPGPPAAGPPPGWYPDPHGQPGYRWWDGASWTEDRWSGSDGDRADRRGLGSVGDMLGETFRVLGQRLGHLFTLAAVIILLPAVAGSVALYQALDGLRYEDGTWTGATAGRGALVLGSILAGLLAQLVFSAAVTRHGVAALQGAPEPWSASLLGGLRRAGRVLWANGVVWVPAFVAAVAAFALAALAPALLVVAIFAIPLALLVLWVRAGLVTTAAAAAPAGVGAVRSSFGLTAGRTWAFLGRFLLLAVLWWAVNTGGSIATAPVSGLAEAPAEQAIELDEGSGEIVRIDFGRIVPDNPAVLGFSLVVTALVQAAASAMTALARASLYRSAGGAVDPELGVDQEAGATRAAER